MSKGTGGSNPFPSAIFLISALQGSASEQKQLNMEKYPSGRRGSPAKGVVRVNRSEGSNPSFSAKKTLETKAFQGIFVCVLKWSEKD